MSYRHSSYRKMRRGIEHARQGPLDAPSRTDGNRTLHWLNARALDKPYRWGRPKGWQWPFGAACTDCAPDGVCEQACTDEPRNPKAKPRAAQL